MVTRRMLLPKGREDRMEQALWAMRIYSNQALQTLLAFKRYRSSCVLYSVLKTPLLLSRRDRKEISAR